MKPHYLCLLVPLLFCASRAWSQAEKPPKDEYKLSASRTKIIIAKGQKDSVKLLVVRSKAFKNGKAMIALNPPTEPGLNVAMSQVSNQPDEYLICLSATAEAKSGEYNFIPTCTLRNKRKGIVLKLIVE